MRFMNWQLYEQELGNTQGQSGRFWKESLAVQQAEQGRGEGGDLLLGGGQHEVVLGVGQAHHHALHTVLAASGQHTEEVNAEGTGQLSGAAYQVQLFQQSQVEASAPQPVLQAPPPTPCHNDSGDQALGIHTSDVLELAYLTAGK